MKKIKKVNLNKVAALAIIVSVSGSGSPAYAITLSNTKSSNTNTANYQYSKGNTIIKKKLDSLVASGNINQFQETAVMKYLMTYKQFSKNPNIDKLSTTGKVTKAQETIISNLFTNYKDSISKAIKKDFNSKLQGFVNLGTFTEVQKNAISNLYTITKTNNEQLVGLNTLVTKKAITQAEENTILNTFAHSKKSINKTINDILLSKLDNLILDGTIDNSQRTAVINLTKISTVDSQKVELHSRLDTLVTVGTITKENESNIINALLSEI